MGTCFPLLSLPAAYRFHGDLHLINPAERRGLCWRERNPPEQLWEELQRSGGLLRGAGRRSAEQPRGGGDGELLPLPTPPRPRHPGAARGARNLQSAGCAAGVRVWQCQGRAARGTRHPQASSTEHPSRFGFQVPGLFTFPASLTILKTAALLFKLCSFLHWSKVWDSF